jgi:flagellar FliL protein
VRQDAKQMSDDPKKEKSSDDNQAAAPASGGGSKMGVLLAGVNLLLTLGIGAVVFLQFQKDKHHEAVSDIKSDTDHASEKKEEGHGEAPKAEGHGEAAHGEHGGEAKPAAANNLITLEQFTVNLSTSPGTPSRFARVVVAVEVSSGEAATEINTKMAPVRNAIIDLFNSKRPADLQTGEGRNFLKEEIRNALNGFLVSGKVKGVFFSNFAVSS